MMRSNKFVGVDLGGTNLKGVVVDRSGRVLLEKMVSAGTEKGPAAVIHTMTDLVSDLNGETGGPSKQCAVGVAAAGVVEIWKGVCKWLPNLPGWKDIPLVQILEEKLCLDSFLINDVRAMTLAEKTVGAGVGVKNLVCMAIGTGIGGGIVVHDILFLGGEGFAGEIGHQTVEPQGPICTCGNYGCLEAVASGASIIFNAIRMVKQGATTTIRDLAKNNVNNITAEMVAQAAYDGDAVAREIWDKEAFYLGVGITNLIMILNPEMIILGGGVAKAFDLLIGGIRNTVSSRIHLGPDVDRLKIVPCQLGDFSGAIGAALWAKQNS
jgi:glucokinase